MAILWRSPGGQAILRSKAEGVTCAGGVWYEGQNNLLLPVFSQGEIQHGIRLVDIVAAPHDDWMGRLAVLVPRWIGQC